jgi:hypothetical protein
MSLKRSIPFRFKSSLIRSRIPRLSAIAVAAIMLLLGTNGGAQASSSSSQSPLGINLHSVGPNSSELPFANLLNSANGNSPYTGWRTQNSGTYDTGEEAYLQVDANGYVTSLVASPAPTGGQKFTYVQTNMNYELGVPAGATYAYPPGQYTIAWIGQGTLQINTFGGDASGGAVVSGNVTASGTNNLTYTTTGAGTKVVTFQVNTPSVGIILQIMSINAADYPRGMYVGLSSLYSAWSSATPSNPAGYFNPAFLTMLQNFKVLRFMDWLQTNNAVKSFTWATAPTTSSGTSATLSSAWTLPSGSYNVAFTTGEVIPVTFTVGSTAATLSTALVGRGTPSVNSYYSTKATTWANRAQVSNAFWGGPNGVPYEICIALANYIGARPWLNISYDASNAFITSLATYAMANSQNPPIIELGNELWNTVFPGIGWANTLASALFGTSNYNQFEWELAWYGVKVANVAQQFYNVYGSSYANGVTVSLGGQAAGSYMFPQQQALGINPSGPPWSTYGGTIPYQQTPAKIGAVHVAPYFGLTGPSGSGQVATDLATMAADTTWDIFFNQQTGSGTQLSSTPSGGYVANAVAGITANVAALGSGSSYHYPIFIYESASGWAGYPNYVNGSAVVNMFNAVNRDARMGTLYTSYYTSLASAGAAVMNVFSDVGVYGQYGEWGILESIMQPISPLSSAPAKWQGVQNFITGNACSGSGCGGTQTGAPAVPMAPTNLQVQ